MASWENFEKHIAGLEVLYVLALSNSTDKFWFWRQPRSFKNSRGRFKALEYLPEVESLRVSLTAIKLSVS